MKSNVLQKVVMIIFIIMIMSSTQVFAQISPTEITGETSSISDSDVDLGVMDDITDLVQRIGTFLSVGVLMIIGIRYALGSIEDKATYKKSLMPYVIGCFILFGASNLAPQIKDMFDSMGDDIDTMGNAILRNYSNSRNSNNSWSTYGNRY